MYALSSLIRLFPLGQQAFLKLNGLGIFQTLCEEPGSGALAVKVITLMTDLLTEQIDAVKTRMEKQGQNFTDDASGKWVVSVYSDMLFAKKDMAGTVLFWEAVLIDAVSVSPRAVCLRINLPWFSLMVELFICGCVRVSVPNTFLFTGCWIVNLFFVACSSWSKSRARVLPCLLALTWGWMVSSL